MIELAINTINNNLTAEQVANTKINTKENEMKYFEGFKEEKEIKNRFKELAKQYHPDLGGDAEIMKIINDQYEKVLEGMYQASGKSITEIEELMTGNKAVAEALNKILALDGINIELCWMWIWVTGDTASVKDVLKIAGFFWASQKKAWYWRPDQAKSNNRRKMTMDEIRYKHGSVSLTRPERKAIA
jgi:hypothetical protein